MICAALGASSSLETFPLSLPSLRRWSPTPARPRRHQRERSPQMDLLSLFDGWRRLSDLYLVFAGVPQRQHRGDGVARRLGGTSFWRVALASPLRSSRHAYSDRPINPS